VAFSPDGRYLASGSSSAAPGVQVWGAATGDHVRTLCGPGKAVYGIAFSPDGKRLAATGPTPSNSEITVTVWDVQTGQKQLTFGHAANACVAFSPDGRLLASGSREQTLKLWDGHTGQELLRLSGHTAVVSCVAFSPDGRYLASGSQDGTIKLWDVHTGQEVLTLRGHSEGIFRVAFSPDGRRLVSASTDRTVRVWDATPAEGEPDPGCLTLRGHAGEGQHRGFPPPGPPATFPSLHRMMRMGSAAVTCLCGQAMATKIKNRSASAWTSNLSRGRVLPFLAVFVAISVP
jgi:WD40 repeat protein